MRFLTYRHHGTRTCGVLGGAAVHPLRRSLLELLRSGPDVLHTAATAALGAAPGPALDEIDLLPPLEPPTVRDFVAFEEHVEGMRRREGTGVPTQWYEAPTFYFTNPYSVRGAYDDVPVPPGSRELDFELEVAAVVGRTGSDLTPERAREHIAGYTVLGDWSARDLQAREMEVGLGPCKGKDTATTLGPWLVTADELESYRDGDGFLRLALTAEVNGHVVGRDLLSNMSWTFEDLVAYASRGTQVRPGDVLGSGTCGNGGCLAELWARHGHAAPPPVGLGDTVRLTVGGIGTVHNTVVPGAHPVAIPPARMRPRDRP